MAATPNTGRTNTRYARLLMGGANISGDMRAVSAVGTTFGQANATAWTDETEQYLAGFGTVMLDGFTALFSNIVAATGPINAGSHTVLVGGGSQYVSLFIGIRAAPAIGNPTFSATFEQGGYTVPATLTEALTLNASFYNSGALPSSTRVWGHALQVGTQWALTSNGVSVDNGAASTGGWIAFLHLPQTATAMGSNDWEFKIEHGSNDSTWATLTTFTANGASITAERKSGTGTVNRYARLVGTRTAGVTQPWVSLIRY